MDLSEDLSALTEFASNGAPTLIATFGKSRLPLELQSNETQIEEFTQQALRHVFDVLTD